MDSSTCNEVFWKRLCDLVLVAVNGETLHSLEIFADTSRQPAEESLKTPCNIKCLNLNFALTGANKKKKPFRRYSTVNAS